MRGEWAEEGFFQRTFAFVTERGPRDRIGSYLAARAAGKKAELSAEDTATLKEWLAEEPAPTQEQLRELAAARVAAVETALREKGIDSARIGHGEPNGEPDEGAPVVRITFRPVGAPAEAQAAPSANPEEGQ